MSEVNGKKVAKAIKIAGNENPIYIESIYDEQQNIALSQIFESISEMNENIASVVSDILSLRSNISLLQSRI